MLSSPASPSARSAAGQPLARAPLGVTAELHHGECVAILRTMPEGFIDAVVTDPPYAIRAPRRQPTPAGTNTELQLPSGADPVAADDDRGLLDAPMLGMQSQNWHEKATHSRGYADNDPVAFQRWCSLWVAEAFRVLKPGGHLVAFGGTRSWHRLACAAEDVGFEIRDSLGWLYSSGFPKSLNVEAQLAARDAKDGSGHDQGLGAGERSDWAGWGTALKPAFEPIVLARKPLIGTVAENVAAYRIGALNVDGCRIASPDAASDELGRWPSNAFMSDEQAAALGGDVPGLTSRFFWVSKPSRRERVKANGVAHPTVKPLDLMQQLLRLVVPRGGLVLDPFAGSGTTLEAALLEGVNVIAVEREETYLPLIEARASRAVTRLRSLDVSLTRSSDASSSTQDALF